MACANIGVGYSARFTPAASWSFGQLGHIRAVDLELVARGVEAGDLAGSAGSGPPRRPTPSTASAMIGSFRSIGIGRAASSCVQEIGLAGLEVLDLGILLADDPSARPASISTDETSGGAFHALSRASAISNWPAGPGWTRSWIRLLGVRRVDLERLLQGRDDRGIQVGDRRPLLLGQRPDELAVADQDLIISALEVRLAGDVVERRGHDQRDPDARQVRP